jgi:hypothetical protein
MSPLGFVRRACCASVLFLACFAASPVRAADAPSDGDDAPTAVSAAPTAGGSRARGQALFEEALELDRGGDFAAACAKLEESRKVYDGIGTSFHLAGCWQKLGRTASAYGLFAKVAERAHELGQTEREEAARARLQKLLPALSRLRIVVGTPQPKMQVFRDGELVSESEWGKSLPVDPGKHEVRVTAEGKVPWSATIEVTEPAVVVAVPVPELVDVGKSAPAATGPKVAETTPSTEPEAKPVDASGATKTVAMIIGGVGLAALGAGALKGAEFYHSNREAKGICPSGTNCTSEDISRYADAVHTARVARTWAYVGIGGGGAALAVATYVFLSAPSEPTARAQRSKSLAFVPLAGRDTWGGALQGDF